VRRTTGALLLTLAKAFMLNNITVVKIGLFLSARRQSFIPSLQSAKMSTPRCVLAPPSRRCVPEDKSRGVMFTLTLRSKKEHNLNVFLESLDFTSETYNVSVGWHRAQDRRRARRKLTLVKEVKAV
jgi:hypothetical protein